MPVEQVSAVLERFDKWHNSYKISTYEEAKAFYAKARNPARGKPLMSWALLKQDGDDFVVHMKHHGTENTEVGRFKPDNTFVFTLDTSHMRRFSITLSQALDRAIPFRWQRVATGRYEVAPTKAIRTHIKDDAKLNDYWSYVHKGYKEESVEIHSGIVFDLATHKPINARPSITTKVDKAKRIEWMRAVKAFRQGLKTKARMGVVDTIVAEVSKARSDRVDWAYSRPDWMSDDGVKVLYTAVKNNDTSTKMIKLLVLSTRYGFYRQPTVHDVLAEFENTIRQNSVALRRLFGVFGEV